MSDPGAAAPLKGLLGGVVLLSIGFVSAGMLSDNGLSGLESQIVAGLRNNGNPADMIGSEGLEETVRDITALGGYVVLSAATIFFSMFLLLSEGRRSMRGFVITVTGAYAAGMLLKLIFRRERPPVPHLSHVSTTSFPSVHAMMSCVLFLSIGLLLARRARDPSIRLLFITAPAMVTLAVGTSRVFLGVHYPLDVLAGWACGLIWLLAAFRFLIPSETLRDAAGDIQSPK